MNVLVVDMEDEKAPEQLAFSLKNTGFAVLKNHPIPLSLIEKLYQHWQAFFKSDNKDEVYFNVETQDGFFPMDISETAKGFSQKDIKEYFQYYPWGQCPQNLNQDTKALYQSLNQLAETLLTWVEKALPKEVSESLSMPLSKMIKDSPNTMLRILHYPPLSGDEPKDAVRAAAHGDINLLTLLVGATQSGLQVKDSNDNWQDVPLDRNLIAVNIGDMLEMCTKGYYRSTLHRVINPDNNHQARLSMPLFLHPRSDVRLSNQYLATEFLQERLKEIGVK